MGYDTCIWIKWKPAKKIEKCPTCQREITDISNDVILKLWEEMFDYPHLEKTSGCEDYTHYHFGRWYEWKKDLTTFSKKTPELVIEAYGEGEENLDVWKARFKNGEMEFQQAKITIPPFEKINW